MLTNRPALLIASNILRFMSKYRFYAHMIALCS